MNKRTSTLGKSCSKNKEEIVSKYDGLTIAAILVATLMILGFCLVGSLPYIYRTNEMKIGYVENVEYPSCSIGESLQTIVTFSDGEIIILQDQIEIPMRQNITLYYKKSGTAKFSPKVVVNE